MAITPIDAAAMPPAAGASIASRFGEITPVFAAAFGTGVDVGLLLGARIAQARAFATSTRSGRCAGVVRQPGVHAIITSEARLAIAAPGHPGFRQISRDWESEAAIHAAWADEIKQRSGDLKDGSVRGLSIEEARRIVASEPADDDR